MIRRQSVQRVAKTMKNQKNQKASVFQSDCCSRVGSDYQVDIPKCNDARHKTDAEDNRIKEIRVWSPDKQPSDKELSEYLFFASKYDYPPELALILLHWHEYNISDAIDDIPNYSPVLNKWTKCEIRKFLKCIDSKPRKNFSEAKKSMPGRPMGEICQLYYSIAAPFKAPTRTKSHSELIEQCFSRAVRMGYITNRWASSTVPVQTLRTASSNATVNSRKPGEAEDPLEREFELHLVSLIGMSKARRILGRRMLSTPYPLPVSSIGSTIQDIRATTETASRSSSPTRSHPITNARTPINGCTQYPLLPSVIGVDYQIGTSSSGASSQLGSDSTPRIPTPRHSLPSGVHYDHDEFLSFVATTEQQLEQERLQVLACSDNLDVDLLQQIHDLDARALALLNEMELLKPSCGFPEISYRWTKTELALVLTAMSRYGDDFATIARTVGSKTEGFIRDFYNQCRHQFPLDEIIRYAKINNTDSAQTQSMRNGDLRTDLLVHSQSPAASEERNANRSNTPVIAENLLNSDFPSTSVFPKPEEEPQGDNRLKADPSEESQPSNPDSLTQLVSSDFDHTETRDRSSSSSSSSLNTPRAKRQSKRGGKESSGVTRGRPRGRGRARGRARGRPGRGRGVP